VAEMHAQNGMCQFKADIQRKIQNYQSILKKASDQMTTERKQQVQGTTTGGGAARKKSSERTSGQYNRTEESVERKQSNRGPGGATDTMTSMKQHYMSKIQTLNQQLESNKA